MGMKKSKTKEVQLTMDMMLKMTPEVFRDTIKVQPLGFKMSLRNLLKAQYEQCNMSKEALINVLAKGEVPQEDIKEYESNIKDLYICMQLIEDRHMIVDKLIQEIN